MKDGSTHVAFGFVIGFVSLDFGLTTVSSCFLIWLDTVLDQPVPTLAPLASRALTSSIRIVRPVVFFGAALGVFRVAANQGTHKRQTMRKFRSGKPHSRSCHSSSPGAVFE
jgi:hypothetical protein